MRARTAFDYAIVRVVPDVARGEFVNAGVIVFCEKRDFLDALIDLDETRLLTLHPNADVPLLRKHLAAVPIVCRGGDEAGALGVMTKRERWCWLTAPRSTSVQTSAPHVGICEEPEEAMRRVMGRVVWVGR